MSVDHTAYRHRVLASSARAAKSVLLWAGVPVLGAFIAVAAAGSNTIDAITALLLLGAFLTFGEGGLKFAFHFFLVFNFGAFALTLGRMGMLPTISIILTTGGLFAAANVLALPQVASLLNRSWTVLLMCALALVSAAWSINPTSTVKDALQLIFGTLLVVAIAGRLGCREALQLVIRSMSFVCVASLVWAIALPDLGVHQIYDVGQTVHAGLWRGVFSHKISLGTFSGLTFSLLVFYGWRAFANPLSYIVSLAASVACIIGAGSATGLATTIFFVGLLFATYRIALQGHQLRRPLMRLVATTVLLMVLLIFSGLLDQFVVLLGRSSDLTGRAEYWPHIIDFMNSEGGLLGFGYGQYSYVGVSIKKAAGMYLGEAHNGFLEMVVAFGYPGALFIIGIHMYLLWQAGKLLIRLPTRAVMIGILPFSYIATLLVSSYAESIILEMRGIWSVLLTLSVCILVKLRSVQLRALRRVRVATTSGRGRRAGRALHAHAPPSVTPLPSTFR